MTFDILWTPTAKVHLQYWQKHNPKQVDKIRAICQSISQDPTIGIGKPERLKFFLVKTFGLEELIKNID